MAKPIANKNSLPGQIHVRRGMVLGRRRALKKLRTFDQLPPSSYQGLPPYEGITLMKQASFEPLPDFCYLTFGASRSKTPPLIIACQEEIDPILHHYLAQIPQKYGSISPPLARAKRVWKDIDKTLSEPSWFPNFIAWKKYQELCGLNMVRLGHFINVGFGLCTQRVALFKLALQRVEILSRIMLGDYVIRFNKDGEEDLRIGHAWVEFKIGEDFYFFMPEFPRTPQQGPSGSQQTRRVSAKFNFERAHFEYHPYRSKFGPFGSISGSALKLTQSELETMETLQDF